MSFVRILWLGWRRSFTDRLSTVHTRFSPSPLHITSLSAGTQNTLLIAWYLALTLAYSNEFREGWKDLPAVRNDRVYVVDASAYTSRSGPRLVTGLEIMA